MSKKEEKLDVFARIAAQRMEYRDTSLIEPQPPKLPRTFLPSAKSDPSAAFQPAAKIDTSKKLHQALAKERKRYEPFLKNLAPKLASPRVVVPLREFDWRLETPADAADIAYTFAGKGTWKTVTIPHFDGPIGRATTYYRATFRVSEAMLRPGAVFVCFQGADYIADVFCNGNYLGSHEGFFAPFEFDATSVVREGENILVVKLRNDAVMMGNNSWPAASKPDEEGDKNYAATGPGYDEPVTGWHHCAPGMGLFQDVRVESRDPLHIHDIFVRPLVEAGEAEAWIEVNSLDRHEKNLKFNISVFGQNFRGTVFRDRVFEVKPARAWRNDYRVTFEIPDAKIWEPEEPWLYRIQVKLLDEKGRVRDTRSRQFGMRSFRMDEHSTPKGRFYLNGGEIRLRGPNTMGHMQQCVMKKDWNQLRDDILLSKLANFNFFRLTQRPVQPEIYEFCDRLGMMTQTDLPMFGYVRRPKVCEVVRQAEEMERLVRSHPCNILISYMNEPSPAAGGNGHRFLLRDEMESFFLACDQVVRMANPDRVIKAVDGDYDPPGPGLPDNHCYNTWYNGHGLQLGKLHKGYWQKIKPGWMFGCGEFGAEALDTPEVMRKYYPKDWLPRTPEEEKTWSPDSIPQAQSGKFGLMWYDKPTSLEEWSRVTREHQAWGLRIMAEAFRRRGDMNTFAVHLGIDAFPSGWMKTIMDVERRPKPGWFVMREACMPLQVHWRTDRFAFFAGETMPLEAWVCNDLHEIPRGAKLHYQLEAGGKVTFAARTAAKIPACDSAFQGFVKFTAPKVSERTVVTARIALIAKNGKVLHDSARELTVFPKPAKPVARRAYIVGPRNGQAGSLARELGLTPAFTGTIRQTDVVLVEDVQALLKQQKRILAAVRDGATAMVLPIPSGEYAVAGGKVKVNPCGMNPIHFASSATGHPLAAGFEPTDLKFWYDRRAGYVTPFLHATFEAKGWRAILTAGNGNWLGTWTHQLAAAEKNIGLGVLRLCQLDLLHRTKTNPAARILAGRLLGLDG
ncbi:MAG: glycoside hydrolase family 2 [Phycisphaerae bacterium]|nr:glycoside hydrolase family 2 [Phycisphaerae bacterium]